MTRASPFFIAVTGAQGVGKSTFCLELQAKLAGLIDREVALLDGLGGRIAELGIPLGSTSEPRTIAAVFTAHLERESDAPTGLVILDRCVVDALAYTRTLAVSSEVELRLFEQVAALAAKNLRLVIHLQLSPFFSDKGGAHETSELRGSVSARIPGILEELGLHKIEIDAADAGSMQAAVNATFQLLNTG